MARMESQQKHTRDNMRVLATIENDDNYRKLMYNKVIEILSQVDTMSIDLAEQLEAETAVIPTRRENGYIVIPLSPEYDNGLCRHVAQVLLISELKKALDHELGGSRRMGDTRRGQARTARQGHAQTSQ